MGWMGRRNICIICLIDIVVWQKLTYHCNVIILQLKTKKQTKNPVSKFGCILRYLGEGSSLHFNIRILLGHNLVCKKWPMSPGCCLVLVSTVTYPWALDSWEAIPFTWGPFPTGLLLVFHSTSFSPLSLETPRRQLSCWLWSITGLWWDRCLYVLLSSYSLAKQPSEWHFSWLRPDLANHRALSTSRHFPKMSKADPMAKLGLGSMRSMCAGWFSSVWSSRDQYYPHLLLILALDDWKFYCDKAKCVNSSHRTWWVIDLKYIVLLWLQSALPSFL